MTDQSFITQTPNGFLLSVRVMPNAKREQVDGVWNGTHLKIALKAPAIDGKANAALISFLSKQLDIKKSAIRIASGQTNRQKLVEISEISQNLFTLLPSLSKKD